MLSSSRRFSASSFLHSSKGGMEKTYYETLNVPRNASRMDVKASYFRVRVVFNTLVTLLNFKSSSQRSTTPM